jgi:hypothetical protein
MGALVTAAAVLWVGFANERGLLLRTEDRDPAVQEWAEAFCAQHQEGETTPLPRDLWSKLSLQPGTRVFVYGPSGIRPALLGEPVVRDSTHGRGCAEVVMPLSPPPRHPAGLVLQVGTGRVLARPLPGKAVPRKAPKVPGWPAAGARWAQTFTDDLGRLMDARSQTSDPVSSVTVSLLAWRVKHPELEWLLVGAWRLNVLGPQRAPEIQLRILRRGATEVRDVSVCNRGTPEALYDVDQDGAPELHLVHREANEVPVHTLCEWNGVGFERFPQVTP